MFNRSRRHSQIAFPMVLMFFLVMQELRHRALVRSIKVDKVMQDMKKEEEGLRVLEWSTE
ncbi:hypothetical protein T12_11094 [Trichinella patagoniensis]|uniref:Uncharacterized protein n=1 Tax=Trichinella patagoniensis TaxID=990121 RepID=A0A0V0YZ16_9BILA|nr:hypothetical protein T12_11094 [Trichinella patagoniensis]